MRTKKATKTARIQIKIEPDKKELFDEILENNNESKTEVLLKCIDKYIKDNR